MKCQNCGTENAKGAKFCEKCGGSLIEKNICPKCGHKNKPSALHCIECGTNLSQPELKTPKPDVETKPKAETSKPKRAISPVVWVLGGVFGVIILCLAAFLLGLIKMPVPPEPSTSILPEFLVSAWTGVYQFQTTGSFSLPTPAAGQGGYVEALYNCDEKGQSPISATTSDKIHDFLKWGAVTQAQVEDSLKYIQFSVFVDENKVNFQGPFQYEIKFDAKNYYYTTPSLVVLNSLAVGTHHIKTEISWTQKIYDGTGYYGPGSENEKLVGNCTVVITQPKSSTGQKAGVVNLNKVDGKICPPFSSKELCVQCGGNWQDFGSESYCVYKQAGQTDQQWCNQFDGEWIEAAGRCTFKNVSQNQICTTFKNSANCSYLGQEECISCGYFWNNFPEKAGYFPTNYCSCKDKNQTQQEWCEAEGGTWNSVDNRCALAPAPFSPADLNDPWAKMAKACKNEYYDKDPEVNCLKNGGYSKKNEKGESRCVCPSVSDIQSTCDFLKDPNMNKASIIHDIECNPLLRGCFLWVLPLDAFKTESIIDPPWIEILPKIILKDGTEIITGREACQAITEYNRIECDMNWKAHTHQSLPDLKFQESDIANIILCQNGCCMELKPYAPRQLLGLTGNCPQNSDLSASVKEWKAGKMTLEIENKAGWTASTMSTDLKDAQGNAWTTLQCKQKTDDNKLMICEGWAAGKTGSASLSFSYGGSSGTCSITDVKFLIPCKTSCMGTCCLPGYSCCSCGCVLAPYGCSSACS